MCFQDALRLSNLFRNPDVIKRIVEASLAIKELVQVLRAGPLIVLTDANKLKCTTCSNEFRWSWKLWNKRKFLGHYVLLVGFSHKSQVVYYRNPRLIKNRKTISVSLSSYFLIVENNKLLKF